MTAYRTPAHVTPDPSREAADLRRYEAELERAQQRRARAVKAVKWSVAVLFIAAVLGALVWFIAAMHMERRRNVAACEKRGGVWLDDEGACVPGFPK